MSNTVVEALGWTLIHSLWQCALLAIVFAAVNLTLRRARANARYLAAYAALVAMPLAALATFLSLTEQRDSAAVLLRATAAAVVQVAPERPVLARAMPVHPLPFLAIIVWFWVTGVMAMSVWSAAGWAMAQRLKRRAKRRLPEIWEHRLEELAAQLGIRRTIRLCESTFAQVPAVIGWMRPVVLIPAGALLNLSAEELEAVLAHELAHIRRFDYLANLVESAIETLMFYHPAVWWISRRIRAEREHCCDDLAVEACGNRIVYARALAALEELRGLEPQFAVAASGGSLAARVRRVLGKEEPRRHSLPLWAALVTVLVAVAGTWGGPRLRAQDRKPSPAPVQAQVRREGYLAGLVDAGYTQISVDEIIELKNNSVSPDYIKGMLQAGLGTPTPKQLINLRNNSVSPEYARAAASAHISDLTFERLVSLRQNGVNVENAQRIQALGFGPFTCGQIMELQRDDALRPDLFEALKEGGYTKPDVRMVIEARRNGLSAGSLRSLREQGFKNLTLEQVIKLKRAGVI